VAFYSGFAPARQAGRGALLGLAGSVCCSSAVEDAGFQARPSFWAKASVATGKKDVRQSGSGRRARAAASSSSYLVAVFAAATAWISDTAIEFSFCRL